MGADLIFSICEMEATKEEAYNNARHLSAPERDENTARELEEMCGITRWYNVDATSEDVYEYLIACIEEVYDSEHRRDCGFFHVDNRKFNITAGMSWGDAPTDAYESYNVCETLGLTLKQPNLEAS